MDRITRDTPAEEILERPGVIGYCVKHGVRPFTCAGGYPCSLGQLLESRQVADPDGFIAGLNELLGQGPS